MSYLEKELKQIRTEWFKNHKIKRTEGQEGFQQFIFGEEGSSFYQVKYVLSGANIFISGDLGDAVYKLSEPATLENIKTCNLSHFTSKLTGHSRERWNFDNDLAKKQIEEYFVEWCDIDNIDELGLKDKTLYDQLIKSTDEWSMWRHFQGDVFTIYQNTSVQWFDSERAEVISECGQTLPLIFIAYWLGLQMIIEQQELEVNINGLEV